MHSSQATVIGFIGVALLLVAFLLNLFRYVRAEGFSYSLLNFVGAALAGYSSYLISFMPFVVLEGVWAAVRGRRPRQAGPERADRDGSSLREGVMRRVRYAVASSLDGYIAGPKGEADWIIMDPDIDFAGDLQAVRHVPHRPPDVRRDGQGGAGLVARDKDIRLFEHASTTGLSKGDDRRPGQGDGNGERAASRAGQGHLAVRRRPAFPEPGGSGAGRHGGGRRDSGPPRRRDSALSAACRADDAEADEASASTRRRASSGWSTRSRRRPRRVGRRSVDRVWHEAGCGRGFSLVLVLQERLDPAIGDEPDQRDGDVNRVGDPLVDEREEDGSPIRCRRDLALEVPPDGPGEPRLPAMVRDDRVLENQVGEAGP